MQNHVEARVQRVWLRGVDRRVLQARVDLVAARQQHRARWGADVLDVVVPQHDGPVPGGEPVQPRGAQLVIHQA